MPAVFWGEAVVTAVYILNRSPTKALNGRTLYEAWHGRKPMVSHLRVFGKELGHIGNLDDRSTPGVFIGYAEGSNDYRILDSGTQRVRTTRDVVSTKGKDGRGTKRWTTARLRRTTTSPSSTSTSRELGEWTVLFHRACLPQSSSLHQPQRYAVQPRPRLQ
jgi:hypothetical protein